MRRKTSVSVRTVVVLPVPPFWERTAIVSAIGARQATAARARSGGYAARWPSAVACASPAPALERRGSCSR